MLYRRRQRLLSAAVAAAISMIACCGWRQADAFAGGLRCGMTVDEVRARARSFGAGQFVADARVPILYGTHVAAEGSSRVYLGFSGDRLQWIRKGSQAGLWTGMRIGMKHDLCAGRELASLVIHGSPGWEGAAVTINGAAAGTLSGPAALLQADVPLGRSEIVIRGRTSTYRKSLSFDRNGQGVVQLDVTEGAAAP